MVYLGPAPGNTGIRVGDISKGIGDSSGATLELEIYCNDVSISILIPISEKAFDQIAHSRNVVIDAAKMLYNPPSGEKCQNKKESSH